MIMEIIVGSIALLFAILVGFLIFALQDARKMIKKTDRILGEMHKTLETVSEAGLNLMHNVNKLTLDIHKKSEALDVLFHPLHAKNSKFEKILEIASYVADGVRVFNKIKEEVKEYVKSR